MASEACWKLGGEDDEEKALSYCKAALTVYGEIQDFDACQDYSGGLAMMEDSVRRRSERKPMEN
jgi:hypothetical protein